MEAINRVGLFAIALVDDATIKVKKARSNHINTDFTKDLILIDNLGNAQKVGTSDSFDGVSETSNYADFYKQLFTFDFYGTNAYTLACNFIALLRSQNSYNLQQTSGLSVYRHSNITNLRQLTGTTYNERYQIEVSIRYSVNVELPTLRIDYLDYEVIYDKPENIVNQNPPSIVIPSPDEMDGNYLISTDGNFLISTNGNYLISNE